MISCGFSIFKQCGAIWQTRIFKKRIGIGFKNYLKINESADHVEFSLKKFVI